MKAVDIKIETKSIQALLLTIVFKTYAHLLPDSLTKSNYGDLYDIAHPLPSLLNKRKRTIEKNLQDAIKAKINGG
uniref:Uncharacterized protein n=1 Tax=viral metagenome TaxID=1070528 RepID=A0A6M3M2D9_9ZZZZ